MVSGRSNNGRMRSGEILHPIRASEAGKHFAEVFCVRPIDSRTRLGKIRKAAIPLERSVKSVFTVSWRVQKLSGYFLFVVFYCFVQRENFFFDLVDFFQPFLPLVGDQFLKLTLGFI